MTDPNQPPREPQREPEGDGGYNAGMAVFSYIIGGIIVWSLIGWGLDTLLKTHWIVLVGALLGIAGGLYLAGKHGLFTQQGRSAKSNPPDNGVEGNGDH
ncbi:AtpZ/AtpI family protein [Sinomonas sp. ASV322]|uniref:AtpZ/AtpI family protein n=1 Tax=Sinomonas sp. ASV322 TaxID=3041920 RepID=UPI0027DD9E69|nr:AtpZ/AtpI family protein [Sinomonas sp. ASV322]MDQ4502053.1 AtpZ/AtpI family protein [Sinomonas sp. ASV322]